MQNKIIYKDILNLDKEITFGIEIEYENIIKVNIDVLLYALNKDMGHETYSDNWINAYETDILEYKNNIPMNGEVKSPVLIDEKSTWIELKKVVEMLRDNDGKITDWCGGHIHIGSQILGEDINSYRNFLLLWILYEKEIFEFSTGEFNKNRKRIEDLFSPISPLLTVKDIMKSSDKTFKYLRDLPICVSDKHHAISFAKTYSGMYIPGNTIEFRIPNGTLREEVFQNYINFFTKFLNLCKKDLDKDKIIYKIKKDRHNPYELASLVFDDEIDKNNFLIQTLKTNNVYNKSLIPHLHY